MARHPLSLTPTLREQARCPLAPPLASKASAPTGAAKSVALLSVGTQGWHGATVAKWTRYGYFSEDGMEFTVTRIL